MEVRDDEISIVNLSIDRHGGQHDAREPARNKDEEEANDEQQRRPPHRLAIHSVAIQQKICTPFGTAMSILEAVKKLAPSCGRPVVNMWCTQSPNDRKPTAMSESTSGRYPKTGRREKEAMIADTMPVAGRKMM